MGTLKGIPDYTGPGVYRIVNTENQMTYIGSSVNINQRLCQHATNLAANRHHCKGLQADYNNGSVFTCEIAVKLHITFRPEILHREFQEACRLESAGIRLYNVAHLCPIYVSKSLVVKELANLYCLEHFGIPVDQLLPENNKAEINMQYELLKTPEMEPEIRNKYAEIIPYLNKKAFYKVQYGVDYDAYLEMTPQEQKAVKQRRTSWRKA